VHGLFGTRWDQAVTPLRIIALFGLVRALAAVAGPVFQGLGKPHLATLWAVPNAVAIVPLLLVLTPSFDVSGAALAMVVAFSLSGLPALAVAARRLEVPVATLLRACAPIVLSSAAMAAVLLALLPVTESLPPAVAVVVLVVCGGAAYVAAAAVLARGTLAPIWVSVRHRRPRGADAGAA
jgi:O-antigen/teichoic acid export membrane protein